MLLHIIFVFVVKASSVDDKRHRGYLAGYAAKQNDVLFIGETGTGLHSASDRHILV